MNAVAEFSAAWACGKLRPKSIALDALFDLVMRDSVAVLHGVFAGEELREFCEVVHRWGAATKMNAAQTFVDENYHAIESGISPRQKTPHNFHAYNFNQIPRLDDQGLAQRLKAIFDPLRE